MLDFTVGNSKKTSIVKLTDDNFKIIDIIRIQNFVNFLPNLPINVQEKFGSYNAKIVEINW